MRDAPILVTGGAGFIGSALVRHLVLERGIPVVNVDALTHAGHPVSLGDTADSPLHCFERADVANPAQVDAILRRHQPRAVIHLAAESRADRAIGTEAALVHSNVVGTFTLLEQATRFWNSRVAEQRRDFRFVHVSTDEAFEALAPMRGSAHGAPFRDYEGHATSKAASDHFARQWHQAHGLPVIVTNASINYGAYQHPERLIPAAIRRALAGDEIPVQGNGRQRRDWLHVEDHVRGLVLALDRGTPGETYRFGGAAERTTLEVVHAVCDAVDEIAPGGYPRRRLVTHVADHPGLGARRVIDRSGTSQPLGWAPHHSFDTGLRETVAWYARNGAWIDEVLAWGQGGHRLTPGAPRGTPGGGRYVEEPLARIGATYHRAVA